MSIPKQEFEQLVKEFRLRELFNILGWDIDRTGVSPIEISDELFQPKIVADKNGFKVIVCEEGIPEYPFRMKLTSKLKALFHEHILIFIDRQRAEQLWLYCFSIDSKRKKAEIRYNNTQNIERLYERASGLVFELDEQDNITIIDVTTRVRGNLSTNAERVTKKFYTEFKKEHTALLGFIEGIEEQANREWYASVMLNRLMFCYFMQRRGFLDNDRNYLRNKLDESRQLLGEGQFYSFYRSFLKVLFLRGFGASEHPDEIVEMIGKIPYLNGGIFDMHEIELTYPDIDISDEAFESIFNLFDRYEWHLDTRETATGNEINPDVLGYIFEKYINDRAQMGAYYTQEDITNYIGRNTILPFLLEATRKAYARPFESEGAVWEFLRNSDDAYIFESIKKGVEHELPDYIQVGIDTNPPDLLERRSRWNESATADYALPTEIWRETIERRNHRTAVKKKIASGEIADPSDFVTCNLDIISFVIDLIDTIDDPRFIQHFYEQLASITILDPTCGSGAFLFAALNILEPLYDSLLSRMQDYLSHDYRGSLSPSIKRSFEKTCEQMDDPLHPNKDYFIHKSIILNNLYGVDIMREAVETAKLRLFLKLVSTADPDYSQDNLGIEPLPDIDFNIKAGNTLIGFASENEIEEALSHDLFYGPQHNEEIKSRMSQMAVASERFKQLQLGLGDHSSDDFRGAKQDLLYRQESLRESLDKLLRDEHYPGVTDGKWSVDYFPFHWVSEFYSIIVNNNGFDVVIGNPPYVEYRKVRSTYSLIGYSTIECGDLYSYVIERVAAISADNSLTGMIVPISIVASDGFGALREHLIAAYSTIWFSTYSIRPGKLFDGVDKRLSVVITQTSGVKQLFSTKYHVWQTGFRQYLFDLIKYEKASVDNSTGCVPKIGSLIEQRIERRLSGEEPIELSIIRQSSHAVLHTRKLRYFVQFLDVPPKIVDANNNPRQTTELKRIYFSSDQLRLAANAAYLSSLFYWYVITNSDCRNLNKREVVGFPLSLRGINNDILDKLEHLGKELLANLQENSRMQSTNYSQYGLLSTQIFSPRKSKAITDFVDIALAVHYGFTDEELDYIINYDIKYRMGLSGEGGDGDDD